MLFLDFKRSLDGSKMLFSLR